MNLQKLERLDCIQSHNVHFHFSKTTVLLCGNILHTFQINLFLHLLYHISAPLIVAYLWKTKVVVNELKHTI